MNPPALSPTEGASEAGTLVPESRRRNKGGLAAVTAIPIMRDGSNAPIPASLLRKAATLPTLEPVPEERRRLGFTGASAEGDDIVSTSSYPSSGSRL